MNTAILTGDVVNSREVSSNIWLQELKSEMNKLGAEPKKWELYRGDSFQLEVAPEEALDTAIRIKLAMIEIAGLNARIAIGVGEKDYSSVRITESNGEAFVFSGTAFDQMKKRTLVIQTVDKKFNELMNALLDFGSFLIDGWSESIAKVVRTTLDHPEKKQVEIARMLGVSQANISDTYSRAGYDKVRNMQRVYRKIISTL